MATVEPSIDVDSVKESAAVVRAFFADAIRGALTDVILGPEADGEPAPELTDDEANLLAQYRLSGESHRLAALRTLNLGIPQEDR